MEILASLVKTLFGKIWVWIFLATTSLTALCCQSFFEWLGLTPQFRWIVGVTAIFSSAIALQNFLDIRKKQTYEKLIISRIDTLPSRSLHVLENIVTSNKQTFKVNGCSGQRIASHFNLKQNSQGYVTFSESLWKELKKKYPQSKENSSKPIPQKIRNKHSR